MAQLHTTLSQGEKNRDDTKELFKLLEKAGWDNNHEKNLQNMRHMLDTNKNLLTCRFRQRSIIHEAKYKSRINYDNKQDVINTIIDVGYNLYQFSADSTTSHNLHALFFAAAKGDYAKLKEIAAYFKMHDVTKIHDTREGDTLPSFMIKFGDHFQEGFIDCFKFVIQENIDIERVDYFNKNLREVIDMETEYLDKIKCNTGSNTGHITKLNELKEIINQLPERNPDTNSEINNKHKLFQALIKKDKKCAEILEQNLSNSDDGENTLLQLAIIKNNMKVTKELLRKQANPNLVVQGGNEETPLVLAARLGRLEIFLEILKKRSVKITNRIFAIFIREIKPKYFTYLLESEVLDVDLIYNDKTPLSYAISRKNRVAVQSLLRRGSRVNDIHLQNINPKDLEDYFNSCIKQDTFADDMEENQYKPLLVFDFFLKSSEERTKIEIQDSDETLPLVNNRNNSSSQSLGSEVSIIRSLGSNRRLKHLLEHPLVHIYMILKWHCVEVYYTYFLLLKSAFYITVDILLYADFLKIYVAAPVLIIQGAVVLYNYKHFKCNFGKYTLHFTLEILILLGLQAICILTFIGLFIDNLQNVIIQISAVVIIFTSLSILLTIGYHFSLSKWMAMAKRVFKNFTMLLLFFMIPIIAFATSFNLLNSMKVETQILKNENQTEDTQNGTQIESSQNEGTDFDNLPRALFRTLVMLGGDIGDKKFSAVGGYIVFLFFTIAMAIILLNFWTGVAVSDIKEIEEQSTIVAFKNVIVFIDSVERMYKFWKKIFENRIFPKKFREIVETEVPFLRSKIYFQKKENRNFRYGIDFYINSPKQFDNNEYFKDCRIPKCVILKIKSLFEEKEINTGKILKELMAKVDSIDHIRLKLEEIQHLLEKQNKSKDN